MIPYLDRQGWGGGDWNKFMFGKLNHNKIKDKTENKLAWILSAEQWFQWLQWGVVGEGLLPVANPEG